MGAGLPAPMTVSYDRVGPLLVSIASTSLTAEEKERLRHPLIGGVVLFARNYESVEQSRQLCHALHALKEPPLLLTVDQEGGRVQRCTGEITRLPPAAALGAYYDADPPRALTLARDLGWLLAIELSAAGMDMTLAPVVDLAGEDAPGVIGDRALHATPDAVAALAEALLNGMGDAGMAGMAKHFPGHGSATGDTHTDVCVDHRSLTQIQHHDLRPYASLFSTPLPAVMTCHVIYPQVDPNPASYSRFWLRQVLREQMKFTGLVVSDDLNMRAATDAGGGAERVRACLSAGCDMAILCNDPSIVDGVLDELEDRWMLPATAVAPLRRKVPVPAWDDVCADPRRQRIRDRLRAELGHVEQTADVAGSV